MTASGIDAKPGEIRSAIILNVAGEDVLEISNHFTYAPERTLATGNIVPAEDSSDPETLLLKLEQYCSPRKSEVYESYKFWTSPLLTPIDHFVADLRTKAKSCNFGESTDRMIRDKIMFSITDTILKARLMREQEDLPLHRLINICRAYEITLGQVRDMCSSAGPTPLSVNKLHSGGGSYNNSKSKTLQTSMESNKWSGGMKECKFCDTRHVLRKEDCPAWGKTCLYCKRQNHFASKCLKKTRSRIHVVEGETTTGNCCDGHEPHDNLYWIGCIKSDTNQQRQQLCAIMKILNNNVKFQLDSGAEVNTICLRHVNSSLVTATQRKLVTWNGAPVSPVGETKLKVTNPVTDESRDVLFVVVPDNLSNLLGLSAIKDMNLITVNDGTFTVASVGVNNIPDQFPGVFGSSIGKLCGIVRLHTTEDCIPQILPARRIPFAIHDEVRAELDRLVNLNILAPVDEPTDWVNQMAVVRKRNGTLRLCVDPRPLNTVLKREHYLLPTLEDSLDKFAHAGVFSKLDVASAYWHLELDESSSLLTTMITPFGRYRWLRLPFGLCVSSEIFQRRLIQALEGLHGVICVADDIVVTGKTVTDHDANLSALLTRCQDRGIRLNRDKMNLNCEQITFLGHVITRDGILPDPAKIEAISAMPSPRDVHDVRRFCGMVQYLAKFVPDLAAAADPLRALTRKDTPWSWSDERETAFKVIKAKVSEASLLCHYDPRKELTLQTDASQNGLGVALLQDGVPVAYASRVLTPTEQRYAQIEKECLSVVYGLERFDQYTYGRMINVQNDHKPLETIVKRPLNAIPKRLQAMMMRLNRYDLNLVYKPGSQVILADTLSRAYSTSNDDQTSSDISEFINTLGYLPITDKRLDEIRQATDTDETFKRLCDTIRHGWPNSQADLHPSLQPYFPIRDCLSVSDDIIVKGECLVIPPALRQDVKRRLHSAHLGKDSMLRRAREIIYWPGMKQEIIQLAQSCDICQDMARRNQKEPLIQHEKGDRPWQKIAADLFSIQGRNYMVTVDYLTNFFEIDYLPTLSTGTIIMKLKAHLARYGIPEVLISDNAQFSSAEFSRFTNEWGINHFTSSPGYKRSNGKAESAVKIAKTLMKKVQRDRTDPYSALLEQRNTPIQGLNHSPAQMMLGRRTRTLLPTQPKLLKPSENQVPFAAIHKKAAMTKQCHDRSAKHLQPLQVGDSVRFDKFSSTHRNAKWEEGTVTDTCETAPRSYKIQGPSGITYRRNRVHMQPSNSEPHEVDDSGLVEATETLTEEQEEPSTLAHAERQPSPRTSSRTRRPPTHLNDFVTY